MSWQPSPIVGGAYADDARPWNFQDTVNWIPVRTERPNGRSDWKLKPAPGFRLFALVGNGPIRGARDVEGKLFVVSGTGLYRVNADTTATLIGTIPGTGRVSLTHNQISGGNEVVIANGIKGYTYNTLTGVLAEIDDDGFPGMLVCDFLDQYILGIDPDRRFAFHSDLADARSYSTIDRFEAESSPDRLVGMAVDHGQWWLFGERTTDVFANTGAAEGTFQRIPGSTIDRGLAGTYAVTKLDNSIFWVADDGGVYRANGYTPVRISTHPIEQALRRSDLTQAFCFTYEDQGHKIVYVTVPDGQTWGFDVASQEWHRRQSYGLTRWRISTLVKWRGVWMAGDYQTGRIYQVDWGLKTEDGQPLIAERVTGVLNAAQNRVTVHGVELVIDTGRTEEEPRGIGGLIEPLSLRNPLPTVYNNLTITPHQYQASGGVQPYQFDIVLGALPNGLTMDEEGLVTGTPSSLGTYAWRVQLRDARGITATLDQGQNALLGIDGGSGDFDVVNQPPALVTNVVYYDTPRSDMTLAADPMGWASSASVTKVRVSPDGIYAAASIRGNLGANRFQLRKYNTSTREWDALSNPASLPVVGPREMAWSGDGTYLALACQDTAPNNLIVYKREGDTFIRLADPASTVPYNAMSVAWDSVDQRLAVAAFSSDYPVYVYDFINEALVNQKALYEPTITYSSGYSVAFLQGVGSRYLAVGSVNSLFVVRCTETPMTIAAGLTVSANVRYEAQHGIHWDATGGYIIGVAASPANDEVSIYDFVPSTIGTESLTYVDEPASQVGTPPTDSRLSSDGQYFVVSHQGAFQPAIYSVAGTPPVLTRLTALDSAGADVTTADWTTFDG